MTLLWAALASLLGLFAGVADPPPPLVTLDVPADGAPAPGDDTAPRDGDRPPPWIGPPVGGAEVTQR